MLHSVASRCSKVSCCVRPSVQPGGAKACTRRLCHSATTRCSGLFRTIISFISVVVMSRGCSIVIVVEVVVVVVVVVVDVVVVLGTSGDDTTMRFGICQTTLI